MTKASTPSCIENYGSESLNEMIKKLKATSDSRRRYEYVLWLAKKLPTLAEELRIDALKVKGCISQVFVLGQLVEGKLEWQGYSDALITRGLLAFLIQGLSDLTPGEVLAVDTSFIAATGLQSSLTPSRANGFLNIFLAMRAQAKAHSMNI
ncbi:SufE family protein [Prochlorococcus sp. MIT 1307]|uniref:SufE family protein n=1 Tax=Prochlorococcus sp. MIT 1307 TaxID=3096219 RepID=UPI002A74D57B|nr:SufE family protein [Prochlorococcus sp. MIT 1307]